MVIREKALLSQMKEAYKGGGYTVIAMNNGKTAILCNAWAVEVDNANVPREALSLMALHMGFLPEEGEAYKILKGDKEPQVQKELFETAMSRVDYLEGLAEKAGKNLSAVGVKKTMLTFDRMNVWQNTGDMSVVLIDPAFESILYKKEDVILADHALYKKGAMSCAWVFCETDDGHGDQLKHLGRMQWVSE